MAETLGKIDKPEVSMFAGKKIIMVPLLFTPPTDNETLKGHVEKYWQEARTKVSELQDQMGAAKYVFHEMLVNDKDVKNTVEAYGCSSYGIIEDAQKRGAELKIIEDKDLFEEFMDWNRILSTCGVSTRKVYDKLTAELKDAGDRRNDAMYKKILDSIGENDIVILMLQEGHKIQFPNDINVFYVSPPALNDLEKYVRDEYMKEMEKRQAEAEKAKENPEKAE